MWVQGATGGEIIWKIGRNIKLTQDIIILSLRFQLSWFMLITKAYFVFGEKKLVFSLKGKKMVPTSNQ